ncbi:hypothetical protein AMATHDRAFT_74599 [Amanita thiersii Skay4041]|uniref:Peptidase M20 dimerisation domain-containing protein n=1 Tax=Amanita thiersii Skay4041 TaxID=703135 RepID=A0A2A9NW24_9AGAR|nr:hypothetical protein AMATHDRAFT_74599 [Amanita thiersii Skay4041]
MSVYIDEKGPIALPTQSVHTFSRSSSKNSRLRNTIITTCFVICSLDFCPQADILLPERNKDLWDNLTGTIGTDDFKARAVNWLAGAVRVPTESFDNMQPVGSDPRWEKFAKFHGYLLEAFPLVHGTLELTKVNTYGLMYVWKGQDTLLKPVLLAAHQDVVPVEPSTQDMWKHPPFSGYFDGERIWGRGSSDDKSGLIGILSAIELLIESDFQPTRTVVLAFGFDEEISGTQGAGYLAKTLEEQFGKDGFAFVIDEGSGFAEQYGSVFATPGIAEKGYIDVKVEVSTSGGHSSVPPRHTSIGILSTLLVHYEAHPFKVHLEREDPLYSTLLCIGQHADSLPSRLRKLIKKSTHSKHALRRLEKQVYKNRVYESQVGTTQAIDLIQGGVKTNALPEKVYAVVNHRISALSSVAATKQRDIKLLKKLASHFNLSYTAFGDHLTDQCSPSHGSLTLSDAFMTGLEPAPVTPTGEDAAPYQFLSGTIKAAYNSHRYLQGANNIFVAPGMMTGNTDTRYYWDLSKHIFRYNHHNAGNATSMLANGIHTVNEFIVADAFLEMIRFFTTLILNADESSSL